jgi:hypothetical protein
MITTLNTTPCYNPYFLNGSRQIDEISFFSDSEIKVNIRRGWLSSNNNDYPTIELPFKVTRKNKIDLSGDYGFYNTVNDKTTLYLPLVKIDHKFLGENIDWQDKDSIHYQKKMEINLTGIHYHCYLDSGETKWKNSENINHTISIKYGYRSEFTSRGKKCEKLSNLFKENTIDLSVYDVSKMLEIVNISVNRK